MPPGRVSRESVRRLLAGQGLKPRHADHMGRREGVFIRQTTDTMLSVVVDVDDLDNRVALFEQLRDVLKQAGYTLEDGSSGDLPRWRVTRPPTT